MKKFFYITAVLLLSLVLAASAGALRSSVYFLGQADSFVFHPGAAWSDTDLFDNFEGLMPGDTRTEEISVRNAANDCDYVKIYLKADAIDDAEMKDFLAQLSMKVENNGKVIYRATPDQTDGLTNYALLGQFNPGDSTTLYVTLEVPLSLSNQYMHREGEVDWTFLAECYEDGEIVEPDDPNPPVDPNHPDGKDLPNTPSGPRTIDLIMNYVAIFAISAVGLFLAIVIIRRNKKQEEA